MFLTINHILYLHENSCSYIIVAFFCKALKMSYAEFIQMITQFNGITVDKDNCVFVPKEVEEECIDYLNSLLLINCLLK